VKRTDSLAKVERGLRRRALSLAEGASVIRGSSDSRHADLPIAVSVDALLVLGR